MPMPLEHNFGKLGRTATHFLHGRKDLGHAVSDRGRIPSSVVEAYESAH